MEISPKPYITNNAGSTLTDYQVPIYLNTATLISGSKMKSDCSDIRVVDASGNSLSYWIASAPTADTCNQTATKLWVKLSSLPTPSSTIYVYYGNSDASAVASGNNVFPIFADFTTGSSLPATWTKTDVGTAGRAVVGGGVLSISNTNGEDVWYRIYGGTHVYSTTTVTGSFVAETLVTSQTGSSEWAKTGISAQNSVAAAVSNGHSFIIVTPGSGIAFQYQDAGGEPCVGGCLAPNTQDNSGTATFPMFLRLTKDSNSQFSGRYSSNGSTWYQRGSTSTVDGTAASQYVTLFVTPHNTSGISTSTYSFFYVRSFASAEPTIGSWQSEENRYASSGTLISSIFDAGAATDFGALTYAYDTATNTSVALRVRTSNNSDMSGATDFSLCDSISSGSDISSNNCVSDRSRYVQYQITLSSSDGLFTPTFTSFSLAFSSSLTYSLAYSASSNGSISGSASQTVFPGDDGSSVTAVAASGYRFARWSDGSTANPRTDADVASNISVSAVFESAPSGAAVVLPAGIGGGGRDATVVGASIGSAVSVGAVDNAGVNVLTYVTNENNFSAPESSNGWKSSDHNFIITRLDLFDFVAVMAFNSQPTTVTLKKGESRDIDLDGDKVDDIRATFVDVYINRAEITIKSLVQGSELALAAATSSPVSRYAFKRDLKSGMTGNDVKELQKYLNAAGFIISQSGAGSPGNETSYFGVATKNALIKLQKSKGINPAAGYFGALTRKLINQ